MQYLLRWHKGRSRYYQVHVQNDLFKHWSVMCVWGGIGNRLGGTKNYAFATKDAALEFVELIKMRRKVRGYIALN